MKIDFQELNVKYNGSSSTYRANSYKEINSLSKEQRKALKKEQNLIKKEILQKIKKLPLKVLEHIELIYC